MLNRTPPEIKPEDWIGEVDTPEDSGPVDLTPAQDRQLLDNGYQPVPLCGKAPKATPKNN